MKVLFGIYYTMSDRCSSGIHEGLRQAGHSVSVFPRFAIQDEVRDDPAVDGVEHVFETLLRRVDVQRPDVVLAWSLPAFFPTLHHVATFRDQHPTVKLVELSQYHPYALWEGLVRDMSAVEKGAAFDMLLCQCQASVEHMGQYGTNAVYYPSFATPMICDLPDSASYPRLTCDVLLPWATMYGPTTHPTDIDRTALALALLDGGITNFRLYGGHPDPELNGWCRADAALIPYIRPETSVHETVMAVRMAKMVVNTSAIGPNPIISPSGYWSDRVPMTMLTGTMCLTDNAESVGESWEVNGEPRALEDGGHIVTYSDIDDCVEKVRHYLQADDERERIAQAGREFARAHLTEDEVVHRIMLPAIEALFTDA